jgi:enterochelin esterase-like enzyme
MVNCYTQVPKVKFGTIKQYPNFATQYIKPRNVDIWLPEGYSKEKKYPVLYMNDGQMLFDSTLNWNKSSWHLDEIVSQLINENKIKEVIVVAVWNTGPERHSEYCPQKPYEKCSTEEKEMLRNSVRKNGTGVFNNFEIKSDLYLNFIVEELKPFIDKNYATLPRKENTFIAGSSMGGLISLYAICEYPEIFGSAACLSTHWPVIFTMEDNPMPNLIFNYLKEKLPDPKSHRIYMDYGDLTLDAMYPPFQPAVNEIMKEKGFINNNFVNNYFKGEDHSEKAWSKRLHVPLEFLLAK